MLPSVPSVPGLPSFPAIGQTPYGNFGPTALTGGSWGAMSLTRGLDYRNPNDRIFAISCDVELFNLPTLPDRMANHLQKALIWHLRDVAESVVAMAQQSLVPGHGYDTGLLHDTLTFALAEHLLETGVYYDLFSEVAYYWRWVEFGHWIAGTNSFWPGYHMLENALIAHETKIRGAVREAWQDTVIKLAAEARAPG